MTFNRRDFLKLGAAGVASTLAACGGTGGAVRGGRMRVVVIGAGFGGATAAKYVRKWGGDIEVTLIERNPYFISCPLSNLVLGGSKTLGDLSIRYDTLRSRYGVKLMQAEVTAIDARRQKITTSQGEVGYDRLIIAPGIDFMYEQLPGMESAAAQQEVLHAWKAGPQTLGLRRQLEAIPNGGVFALSIPKMPYRCPPGPYERVCQVANYFKKVKPRCKIVVLDGNPDITSKKDLFRTVWSEMYPGLVDYRPNNPIEGVDARRHGIRTEFDAIEANVLNVIPPQKAGAVAAMAGAVNVDGRWCEVDFLTYESKVQKNVHIIGDAVSAPLPKSGHMANQTAKICAGAVVALLRGEPVYSSPVFANTCYSFVNDRQAMHVAAVYRYDPQARVMVSIKESSGVSSRPSDVEGNYAQAWARNIWSDVLL